MNELLALGDISVLYEELTPDPSRPHSFDYDERQKNVTVAYGRDRGETDIDARAITLEQSKESWCEYMYVYGRDGVWRYYDLHEEKPDLRDIENDLNAEFEQMGILRPEGEYGYFPQSEIDKIKAEQAQMQKSEAVM